MIRIVLASHGHLAEGMKGSVALIMGSGIPVDTICAYCDPDVTLEGQIDRFFADVPGADVVIVVTDVFGGSVNNEFMKRMVSGQFELIAGMNMALIIQLAELAEDPSLLDGDGSVNRDRLAAALQAAIQEAQRGQLYCNHLLDICGTKDDF